MPKVNAASSLSIRLRSAARLSSIALMVLERRASSRSATMEVGTLSPSRLRPEQFQLERDLENRMHPARNARLVLSTDACRSVAQVNSHLSSVIMPDALSRRMDALSVAWRQ